MNLKQLQEYMARLAEEDRKIRSIEVEADSMEEGLEQASVELGIPVRHLECEVLDRGSQGFWGVGAKKWQLKVYEKAKEIQLPAEEEELAGVAEETVEGGSQDVDGEVFVRITQDGVFLKATQPLGRGRRATERMAMEAIRTRNIVDFDGALVSKVVRRADEEYVQIGRAHV